MILSIIIPVYNTKKYLRRCLKSVFAAITLAPKVTVEVLLIDNDSTDGSLELAQDFAKTSPLKVTVLQCHTPGASAVRNFGASKAKGDYIWFIDSDDEISSQSIQLLVSAARKKDADITMLGAKRAYKNSHSDYLSAIDPSDLSEFKSRFVRYGAGPWQFLFKRSWWVENGFSFKEGIIHEDMELISSLILYTDQVTAVDQPLYTYYETSGSVLHKNSWDPHYLDIFPALTGLYYRFKKKRAVSKYHDELEWFFIWNLLLDSNKDFSKFKEGRVGFAETRKILKSYFPSWRHNRFLKQKSWKLRLRVRLNYYKR